MSEKKIEFTCIECDSKNVITVGDHSHCIFLCNNCGIHWYKEEPHFCGKKDEDYDYIYRRKSNVVIITCKKCGKIFIKEI